MVLVGPPRLKGTWDRIRARVTAVGTRLRGPRARRCRWGRRATERERRDEHLGQGVNHRDLLEDGLRVVERRQERDVLPADALGALHEQVGEPVGELFPGDLARLDVQVRGLRGDRLCQVLHLRAVVQILLVRVAVRAEALAAEALRLAVHVLGGHRVRPTRISKPARKPDAFRERAAEALRGARRRRLERVSGWSLVCARAVRDCFDACAARCPCV